MYVSLQFASLQREIDSRDLEIEKLKVEQQKLHGIIKALEKDIMGLKREIQERDETIQDKVGLEMRLSLVIIQWNMREKDLCKDQFVNRLVP